MASAERELGAFMRAVSEMFGAEHARRAADDWLDEFERMDTLPETRSHLGVATLERRSRRRDIGVADPVRYGIANSNRSLRKDRWL